MNRLLFWVTLASLCWGANLRADGLKILPTETTLNGPQAVQRLIVLTEDSGKVVGDSTAAAKFESANPAVAKVDSDGTVRAVGDGETVITASRDGQKATVKVKVVGTKEASVPSFRNHVIPMM